MDLRILWLALGAFAVGIDGFLIGSLLPAIADETHSSIAQAGYIAFAFSAWGAVGNPVLLALIGGADRRMVLAASALVFTIGAAAMWLVPGLAWLIVARLVIAAGAGVYTSMGQATAMALVTPERRGRAVTAMLIGSSAAVAIGVPAGAWIAGIYGWRLTYFLMALIALGAAFMLWFLLPKGMTGVAKTLRERLAVVTIPGVPKILLTTICMYFGAFLSIIYIAPLTMAVTGQPRTVMPIVLVAYGVGAVIANVFGGRIIDRFGGLRTTIVFGMLQCAMLVSLGLCVYAPAAIVFGLFVALIFAFAVSGWTFHAAQITRVAALAADQAPLAISINGTAINAGSGLSALVGGIILERIGVLTIPWFAAALSIIAIMIIVVGRKPAVAVASA